MAVFSTSTVLFSTYIFYIYGKCKLYTKVYNPLQALKYILQMNIMGGLEIPQEYETIQTIKASFQITNIMQFGALIIL